MNSAKRRIVERSRRAARVRKTISGTAERPRLCVRRSINHIYAQIIDDVQGKTLAYAGSTGKEFSAKISGKEKLNKMEVSKIVGEILAEKAVGQGVKAVVFDRKGYLYHGRVKALAEGARSKGLVF
ncbi:MAG: 50S ribosomal protein L18 [Chitinispirillales bacterium]|jgi:large subunit ribosomal protein L18|nr:50S ribosomal protein L18 [Chitinispirillales bacterium]